MMSVLHWDINLFLTNDPNMDKPGSWFSLAKCLKNTCGRVTFYVNATLPQVFFKHFASKIQLPGFYISGILVENGLTDVFMCHFEKISISVQTCSEVDLGLLQHPRWSAL